MSHSRRTLTELLVLYLGCKKNALIHKYFGLHFEMKGLLSL